MKKCHVIRVLADTESDLLAGAASGSEWCRSVRASIESLEYGLVALDFSGVRLATVSWLREGVLSLVEFTRAVRTGVQLVAANLVPAVQEELAIALDASREVLVAVELDPSGQIDRPRVIGRLDPALRDALRVVQDLDEFDAPMLSRAIGGLGLSAANNRLAAIEAKGVLRSERRGRGKVYRPVLEGLHYGQ